MCFYKKTLAKNLGFRASCSARLPRGRPPGRVNLTDSKSMEIAIMSASFEILLDGASGPTSRLGQFRTRAGCKLRRCFFYFSTFGLFSQTKTKEGRPGLGRLYSRRDLARCPVAACQVTQLPADPLFRCGSPNGVAGGTYNLEK